MKHLIFLLILLFGLPLTAAATTIEQVNDTTKLGSIPVIKHPRPGNRPNSLGSSIEVIMCEYGIWWLRVSLPKGTDSARVKLTNLTSQWEGIVTKDEPVTEIPELEGRYTLILLPDNGEVYSGVFELDTSE